MKAAKNNKLTPASQKNGPFFNKQKGDGDFFASAKKDDRFFGSSSDHAASVQTKLTVGKPNDPYEKEADSMADKVVQRLQRKCEKCEEEEKKPKKQALQKKAIFESNEPDEKAQRKCEQCEKEDKAPSKGTVQKKSSAAAENAAPSSIESTLHSARGSGQSLPPAVRQNMESAFGNDFSGVRIHTDSRAAQLSKQLNAQAFTLGSDVYFNAGRYDTDTRHGQHLLAHELTHTVQQGASTKSIQRAPDDNKCDENSTTKLSIDEVTKNCPASKGDITEAGGVKALTISNLRVKSNAPKTLLESLEKPLTLPKPGSRKEKENQTQQVSIWGNSVKEDIVHSLEALLSSLNQDQTLESKKDPKNKYSLKLKTGKGIAVITGTFTELQNNTLISKWNTAGKPMAFQVEHILDYQVAGKKADAIENLMLLSAAVNNDLGAVMRGYIRNDIESVLSHYNKFVKPGDLVEKADEAREKYDIKAKDFVKVNPSIPADEEILRDSLKTPSTNPLRQELIDMQVQKLDKDHFILKSNKKGGGVILPYKQTKFHIGSYELTTDGDPVAGTISSITAKQIINGPHTEQPEEKTYALTPVAGEAQTYKAADFGNVMAKIKLNYLSLVEFEPPDLDEGLNITASGKINAPSPKFLSNTPIEVNLVGRDLSIQKTFSPNELGAIGPIKIDSAALTLSLSTENGFGASGTVALSIPKAGKGQIEAKADKKGFSLNGKFDFDTKTFDKATVSVGYDSIKDEGGGNPWTISGTLAIGKNKVKGIDSATITVGYDKNLLTLKGKAALNVPGIKSASIDAQYGGGDFKIAVTAQFDFKSKFIQDPNITVTLSSGDGEGSTGYSLGVAGSMNIVIPNFKTIGVTVKYEQGKFDASTTINDLSVGKYVTVSITLGATNSKVDEATGKISGEGEGKELHLYGSGSITVHLTENLASTVEVKFTREGKIVINGEIKLDKQPLYNKDLLDFTEPLFKIGTPNIPIFSIGVGDIFLRIEGDAKVFAKVKAPVLTIVVKLKDTDIFDPKGFNIDTTITPEIAAEAGLDLGVKFIIGARALILEISANIGGTLGLHIVAGAKADLKLTWSNREGLKFKNAEASMNAGIVLTGAITGGVSVDLNLFFTRVNVWKKDWELAKMDFGNLGQMGFKFPLNFDANGNFVEPDHKSLKPESPLAGEGGTTKFLSDKAAGGENKVEKKPEDFNTQILNSFIALPAIGPANPRYTQERSRHSAFAEIQKSYPDRDWEWLKGKWANIELNEFFTLATKLRQPRSDGDKLKELEAFAQDHPTVSRADIDILAREIEKSEGIATPRPNIQKSPLRGVPVTKILPRPRPDIYFAEPAIQRTPVDKHELTSTQLSGDPILKKVFDNESVIGMNAIGGHVKRIQEGLMQLGIGLPIFGADSKFGEETKKAVIEFQQKASMSKREWDGIVGRKTIGLLDRSLRNNTISTDTDLTENDFVLRDPKQKAKDEVCKGKPEDKKCPDPNTTVTTAADQAIGIIEKVKKEQLPPVKTTKADYIAIFSELFRNNDSRNISLTVDEVKGVYDDIEKFLLILKSDPSHVRCGTECDGGCRSGSPAYHSAAGGKHIITFCPDFDKDPRRIFIVLHESHHAAIKGSRDIAYQDTRLIGKLDHVKALLNAASFHLYARLVDDPASDIIGPKVKDTNNIANPVQKRAADQALAFMHQWFKLITFDMSVTSADMDNAKEKGAYGPDSNTDLINKVYVKWFQLTPAPAPPKEKDVTAAKAIEERSVLMEKAFNSPFTIQDTSGSSEWARGPGKDITLNQAVLNLDINRLVIALLQELVHATPDISADREALYVGLINDLRNRRKLDP